MDEQRKKKTLKCAIVVLTVLLGISVAALAGTLIYRSFLPADSSSVVVPDNIIIPGKGSEQSPTAAIMGMAQSSSTSASEAPQATEPAADAVIRLHKRNPDDNLPYKVGNMFPGDAETKCFCIQVSYSQEVTVNCCAKIRPGYEKLAEVLKCRVVLLTTGNTVYDGLLRDMPESLFHTLSSDEKTTTELYYEVTVSLDTSVGNEYQNCELIADLRWWAEGENLVEPPVTGDDAKILLHVGLMLGSLFILILLFAVRKKEERDEQNR